jgi:hypothetical protein
LQKRKDAGIHTQNGTHSGQSAFYRSAFNTTKMMISLAINVLAKRAVEFVLPSDSRVCRCRRV